jgi:hypothetical protein
MLLFHHSRLEEKELEKESTMRKFGISEFSTKNIRAR